VGEKNGRVYDRFRNRLMFPIIDVRGNVIGFGGRVLDKSEPKYLNSNETLIFNKRKNLFGLNFAKKTKQPNIILVEGNIDVVTLHQYGFDNAVASLGTSLTEDQVTLLSRYTEEVILTYDGDEAGQRAAKRAIPMLEKAGIKVRVLQVKDAKDPDEFLQKFGADKFKLLLEESANRVEYQLNAIRCKYDLRVDDQKILYVQESAELIASLDSSVKREVYGGRVAEAAGITVDAVKLEVEKARKIRLAREKKKQEQIDLTPVRAMQPKERSIRYDNVKSAMAEETVIAQSFREPAMLDNCKMLTGSMFSVPLFGRVFDQLQARYGSGLEVSLAVLEDLSPEEVSHIAGICQKQTGPVNQKAFSDCVKLILSEQQRRNITTDDDLMALRNKLKESKGANV